MSVVHECEAIKVLPSGIIVRLGDGREGFLPRREFMLSGTRDLRQVFQPGQRFQAVGEDGQDQESGRVLLQLVSQDHWNRLLKDYPVGSTVTGLVTGVEPYGVFVNLLPGVTGLAPREEMTAGIIARTEDAAWIGDMVRCQVASVDTQEHRVTLSIRAARAGRSASLESGNLKQPAPVSAPEVPTLAPAPASTVQVPSLRILIVDDQAELRDQLADHLMHAGHAVQEADSAMTARVLLEAQSFDLMVADVAMPGMTGLELADQVLLLAHHPRIILMTDWSRALTLQVDMERLHAQGVDLITKPRHALELDQILQSDYGNGVAQDGARRRRNPAAAQFRSNLSRMLNAILRDVVSQTSASLVLVFSIDSRLQRLHIVGRRGDDSSLRENELQAHWRYSPIRDAIEDGDLVVSKDALAEREQKRFQYLLRILDFGSCVGYPVNAQSPTAVFAFHPAPHHFTHNHEKFIRAAAERIGAAIDRDLMEKSLAQMQRYVLLGQLSAVVVHEINNKFGASYWLAKKLPDDLKTLERRLDGTDVAARREAWHKSYNRIQEIIQSMSDLDKIVEGFHSLLKQQGTTRLNVHEIVEQAVASSHSLAQEAHVQIHTHFDHPTPYVFGEGAWLQQAFLNTLLNAIQQIQESKATPRGNILVSTGTAPGETHLGLQIRIADDGPGIHSALRERIFDLGFTTREQGSGIGLFMTRNLVQSMGGRISIQESHILWGTTFLIELPVADEDDGPVEGRG
ncbi:MAG: ATP-binding protein [Anaerolineae bacterium]